MRRTYLFLGLIGACAVASVVVWRTGLGRSQPARAGQQPAASAALPLNQVILFNNGIGYFQREGEIDGSARVDLSFPATDVNDLIKANDVGSDPGVVLPGVQLVVPGVDPTVNPFADDGSAASTDGSADTSGSGAAAAGRCLNAA